MMLFWIAGLVILLDQLTKMFVESRLPLYDMWAPIPSIQELFRITHVPNTGMAFGLFPSGSSFFLIVAVVVALAIIYYNFTLPKGQFALRLALGLQLGGALGNFVDRLRIGHVTDFLDFGPWPVFNVADMAIVSGAIVLGWLVLQETREEYAQKKREAAANATELSGTSDEFSTP
ncbi:MAG: signal peptidase II [Chloroflexi bacterium]|nr:MAG: signal peptidase II [Chloroflexota bacterium]